uniref:Uncharacterized protein n=1 Tax=Ascaris lumbricoides TaxID=6252 RepID=A0A0M3HU77_ASCLU
MTLVATSEGLQLRLPHHASVSHTSSLIHAEDVRRDNTSNYSRYGELASAAPKPMPMPSSCSDSQLVKVSNRDRKLHEKHSSKIPRIKRVPPTFHSKSTKTPSKKGYRGDEIHGKY